MIWIQKLINYSAKQKISEVTFDTLKDVKTTFSLGLGTEGSCGASFTTDIKVSATAVSESQPLIH